MEDSAADIGLVREALQEHRVACEVTVLLNGARAVQFLNDIDAGTERCPDLFVIDLNLPKKPGSVVLERLRASKVCDDIPVVVLTSSDSQKDKDEVAKHGSARYIRKPTQLEEFLKLGAVFQDLLTSPR